MRAITGKLFLLGAIILCTLTGCATQRVLSDSVRAQEISDLRFGMFICWSYSTFSGVEWTGEPHDVSFFKATTCNTDQWAKTAKEAGMNYILFLTKHHDGFCLWDTQTTDLKVTNAPLQADVLKQLQASCKKYGIKLALYFSEGDWNWPGAERGGNQKGGSNPEAKKAQLKELLTQYGPIEFIWFDHAVGDGGLSHDETTQWVHAFQPNCFVGYNHGAPSGRLSLRERGCAGPLGGDNLTWVKDAGDNEKSFNGYRVAEFTYPLLPPHKGGADWFYSLPEHDNLCFPATKIFNDYKEAIKYGNIFSLNVGPDYEGNIREIDRKVLQQVGEMIRNKADNKKKERYITSYQFPKEATVEEKVRLSAHVVPSNRQLEWQKMEFTSFICYGINTFTDREWGTGTEDPALFNPTDLDAGQWVRTAKEAGMRMVLLTCKHHDGFCLWPSAYTKFSVASTPWRDGKGDLVREVAENCKEQGLKFAVYLSPWDMNHPDYGTDRYNDYFVNQLTELLTQYGKVDEVWFDGACGEGANGKKQVYDFKRYYKVIRDLQPEAVIAVMGPDVRWVGTESGYGRDTEWSTLPASAVSLNDITESSQQEPGSGTFLPLADMVSKDLGNRHLLADATGVIWYPSEVDVSIRPGWYYHASEDLSVKTPQKLIDIYYSSVGKNSLLLLNLPPDKRGLIHENDVKSLMGMRQILEETFRDNLLLQAKSSSANVAKLTDGVLETYWQGTPNDYTIELSFNGKQTFDRLLLQENITEGQRVESFVLEGWINGKWQFVTEETTIGYKRILRFDQVEAEKARIVIRQSRDTPQIAELGIYKASTKEHNP